MALFPECCERYLRTIPQQRRSVARLDALLDATGRVLDRGGLESLTMTAVATEAGIPPASLYDYVADTRGLLACFSARSFDRYHLGLSCHSEPMDTPTPHSVRRVLGEAMQAYVAMFQAVPGLSAAMVALDTDAELAQLKSQETHRNAVALAALLQPLVESDDRARLHDRCLLACHLAASLGVMVARLDHERANRLIETYVSVFTDFLPDR